MTVMLWVDRPIYAMINLSRDVEEAQRSTEYKIGSYINFFKGEYVADLDEQMEQLQESERASPLQSEENLQVLTKPIGKRELDNGGTFSTVDGATVATMADQRTTRMGGTTMSGMQRPIGTIKTDGRFTQQLESIDQEQIEESQFDQ